MILGFAHLAVNVANLDEAELTWQKEGYIRNAMYPNVPNHPNKQKFLTSHKQEHDLMLLSGEGLWPLELTMHGPIHYSNTQLTWERDAIVISVPDPASLSRFFVDGLNFKVVDRELVLSSFLPGWSCRLRLEIGSGLPPSLDAAGLTCLAFYCNNIVEDTQHLIDLGARDSTGCFDLTLGEKTMTIAMLRIPGGPLVELINLKRK